MQQEFTLVQKIVHKKSGQELDLAFLEEFVFIEEMTLASPRLILRFNDNLSVFRDSLKLAHGDEIELTLADTFNRDGMQEVLAFTIISMSLNEDLLTINCLLSALWKLKRPAVKATAFIRKHPLFILKKLFPPDLRIEMERCFPVENYHILVGERPTLMLNQLAQEQGGHIFIQRRKVLFSRIAELMKKEAAFTYYYNDVRQGNQIIHHTKLSGAALLQDKVKRGYKGWNLTKGLQRAFKGETGLPSELYPSENVATLKKVGITQNPEIEFTCVGNGFLTAGMTLDLVWNLEDLERVFDESMPERVVTWLVAHYYSKGKYFCRIKGVTEL